MKTTAIATKFVKWDISELDTLKGSKVYQLRQKLNNGGRLNREEKNWITEGIRSSSIYFNDSIALMGCRFDFSDVLKTFVVKQYGWYQEYKACDRTSLRTSIYGRIDRIIEI